MGKLVVVHGATTNCTGSGQSSFLLVPPDLQIEVDGLNPGTIAHHVPGDNILPFGPCKHLGGNPCVPVTPSPWDKGEPSVPFGPDPSLNMDSCLKCTLGGTIELLSSGQSNPFLSTDCNASLSAQLFAEWYGRKQNADAATAQMDAENEAIDEGPGFLRRAGGFLADIMPVVGTGKGIIEAFSGRDLATGEELAWWERGLGVIPIVGKPAKKAADGVGATRKAIKGSGDEAGEGASKGAPRTGKRRKNRISDQGQPETIQRNRPGTTVKKFGKDGWVEKEFNKGHGKDAPEVEQGDHIHDHTPNPHNPQGRPIRQKARPPTPQDYEDFGIDLSA